MKGLCLKKIIYINNYIKQKQKKRLFAIHEYASKYDKK